MSAADDSARLNEAIKAALEGHTLAPVNHDVIVKAKEALGEVEAKMRSGSFGGYFVEHDVKLGYDVFGMLCWRFEKKF